MIPSADDGLDDLTGERGRRQRAMLDLGRMMHETEMRNAERPKRPALTEVPSVPFLPTSVATLVFGTIERCVCMRGNGLIVGAPGTGKTMAIAEAQRRSNALEGPEVAVLKVEPAYGASALVLLEELAPLLGVSGAHSVAATVRRLKRDVMFRPLLIFDEAQNLSLRIVHQLLSISEDTDVRMVFVGNPETVNLINSKTADVRLISRRLPYRGTIDAITDDDADLVASHFGVEEMDGYRLCRRIGSSFHMDGIVQVLRDARHRQAGAKTIRPAEIEASLQAFPHIRAELDRTGASRPIPLRQRTAGTARLTSRT